jgi:hypothetical protein
MDAEIASGFKEGYGNHQIVAKVERMRLSEGKIVRHFRVLHRKRANSR